MIFTPFDLKGSFRFAYSMCDKKNGIEHEKPTLGEMQNKKPKQNPQILCWKCAQKGVTLFNCTQSVWVIISFYFIVYTFRPLCVAYGPFRLSIVK